MRLFKYSALVGLFAVALITTLAVAGGSEAAATPVSLGVAGNFAVLAGSGITNTGATTLHGDSGSSPTSSETGFAACPGAADCVTQTGTNHTAFDPNDTATQNAKAALTHAYDLAAGQTPTEIPTELAGQRLTPGVYSSASGTFGMNGTLTLDAVNNRDAVFIFQTAEGTGTLITGGTGNVRMIRAAQSCHVLWKVGTSATLGANSTFRGTILAHTSISLDTGVTVDGSLLAGEQAGGAGAVTMIHDTVSRALCSTAPPPTSTPTPTDTTATMTTPTTTTVTPTPTPKPKPKPKGAASKAAAAKAVAARAAAAKKAAAKKAAAVKAATSKARRAAALRRAGATSTSGSTSTGSAQPPIRSAGFTG